MALVKRLAGLFVVVLLMLVTFGAGWLVATLRIGSAVNPASLSTLEQRFTEQMKGATLVGRFTVTGREDRQASQDRYDVSSVEKVGDDQWRFNTRIRYGSVDATVPVVVPMRWVGDTPMITMTDVTIPTMGTFSARVFFYGDRYAGTWQHGAVGGHMFGRIEKSKSE